MLASSDNTFQARLLTCHYLIKGHALSSKLAIILIYNYI